MKQPTDKDLRLYESLSDVDSQFILDSTIPLKTAPVPAVKKASKPSLWAVLCRPQYASVVLAALLVTLTVVALLVTGITKGPQTEPPPHGIPTDPADPIGSVKTPTVEDAAILRKGMSFTELAALMGNNYTQEGTRYTFTLDTGEQLAVSTAPNDGGEPTVTGFEWLGSAGKTYNPMGIPAEILQKVQEYATDRVIPVYAMSSLIGQYDSTTPPTLDEILKDAELAYLRMAPDGETVIVNQAGMIRGSFPRGGDFSLLTEVSALFDDSVRVKAYYPILSSKERGAVYFQTSIGDYILYLHGESLPLTPEGLIGTADAVPYLMPAAKFHEFAYGVVSDQKPDQGMSWTFSDKRMAVIESCKMTAADYRKPINIATPEAAEQIKVGMQIDFYGNTLTALLGNGHATMSERMKGIFYWELTDGRGFVVTAKTVESYSGRGDVCAVTSVGYFDSAEMLEDLGQPSLANAALIREGVSLVAAEAVMGAHDHPLVPLSVPCVWTWQEEGHFHTLTIDWRLYTTGGGIRQEKTEAGDVTLSKESASSAAAQVKVGMTQTALIQLMGKSHSTAEQQAAGILYWKKDKGRSLFVYCRPDPWSAGSTELRVTDVVWLESGDLLDTLGRPSCAVVSQLIRTNMSREAVVSLLGKAPGGTYVSSSTSAPQLSTSSWTWEEDRKTYTFTVHWLTAMDNGDGTAEILVREMTLTEALGPLEKPTPAMAEKVTVGMTDTAVLSRMSGIPYMTDFCGEGILYVWELSDGRYFGAVLENRAPEGIESYRFTVTHTFYWDTAEEIGQPTRANAERITQGMSYAAVVALIGEPDSIRKRDNGTIQSTVHWLTDRNLLSVEIEWLVIVNTKTGAIYHMVHEAVIAVG